MLSDKARGDANPILLIDENEVTAGHAASVGRVDPEEMYYLMSTHQIVHFFWINSSYTGSMPSSYFVFIDQKNRIRVTACFVRKHPIKPLIRSGIFCNTE